MGFVARPVDRRRHRCRAATCRAPIRRASSPARCRGAWLPEPLLRRLARALRYPRRRDRRRARRRLAELGRDFGGGLYEAEVDYLVREEWARTVDDVLWRRSSWACMSAPRTRCARLDGACWLRVDAGAPGGAGMSLRLDGVSAGRRRRGGGSTAVARAGGRAAQRAARADARGQDLAAADDGGPRPADRRPGAGRRRATSRACRCASAASRWSTSSSSTIRR